MSIFLKTLKRSFLKHQCLCRHLTQFHYDNSKNYDKFHFKKTAKWKLLAVSGGIFAGITLMHEFDAPKVEAATTMPSRRSQFNFIADVVETASKSLVYIEIQDTRRMDYYTGKLATISNGSGFIVETDGLILTNAHVVINKPRSIVSVRLNDGRSFQGIVEAVDPISDLATVRIQCKNFIELCLSCWQFTF